MKSLLYGGLKVLAGLSSMSLIIFKVSGDKKRKGESYQIDPEKCVACGNCAHNCVRQDIPAIQAINDQEKCGFCERCVAYFVEPENGSETGENLVCPYKALTRTRVDEFKYRYTVDHSKCRGCGRCVKLCKKKGQSSLKLFVNENLCLHCKTCSAKAACPHSAFILVD